MGRASGTEGGPVLRHPSETLTDHHHSYGGFTANSCVQTKQPLRTIDAVSGDIVHMHVPLWVLLHLQCFVKASWWLPDAAAATSLVAVAYVPAD